MRNSIIALSLLVIFSPCAAWARGEDSSVRAAPDGGTSGASVFPDEDPFARSPGDTGAGVGTQGPRIDEARILAEQSDEALDRGSEAAPDPWLVSDSTQLFSRPTLSEAFKVSAESTETGAVFSLTGAPGVLWDAFDETGWAKGLQLSGSYAPQTREATLGLKFNYSFREARVLSDEQLARIQSVSDKAFDECYSKGGAPAPADVAARIEKCEKEPVDEAIDAQLAKEFAWRPTLSFGLAGGHNFETGRSGKLAFNGAVEVPVYKGFSAIANVDLENSEVSTDRRRWSWAGSGALNYVSPIKIELSFATKYIACLSECDEDSSLVRFGPRIAYPVTDDTLLALGLTWEDKATGIGDAFAGVAFSHTLEFEKKK